MDHISDRAAETVMQRPAAASPPQPKVDTLASSSHRMPWSSDSIISALHTVAVDTNDV